MNGLYLKTQLVQRSSVKVCQTLSKYPLRFLSRRLAQIAWQNGAIIPKSGVATSESITLSTYEERARQALIKLGIPASVLTKHPRTLFLECNDLVSIGLDMFNREQRLERRSAAQWQSMVAAAKIEGVALAAVSGFRSFDYQYGIIERKLASGLTMEQIICVSALPGYSEHHTGRAIDIGTPGFPALTEEFEQTPAFAWLSQRARDFGFTMSFPKDNPFGIIYEPWHWLWSEPSAV